MAMENPLYIYIYLEDFPMKKGYLKHQRHEALHHSRAVLPGHRPFWSCHVWGKYLPRFTGNHLYPILPDYSEILHCYFVDIRITVYDIYNIYIYVYTTSSTTSSNH